MCDEDVGGRMDAAIPWLRGIGVLEAFCRQLVKSYQRQQIIKRFNVRELGRAKLRNIWSTKDGNFATFDFLDCGLAFEVDQVLEIDSSATFHVLWLPALRIEPTVVISSYHDFDSMWLLRKPIDLLLDVFHRPSIRQITSMNEDVSCGDWDGLIVRVGDAYYFDSGFVPWRMKRPPAQKKDDAIKDDGEVGQGRREQVVE
jgi:hypothetical protein